MNWGHYLSSPGGGGIFQQLASQSACFCRTLIVFFSLSGTLDWGQSKEGADPVRAETRVEQDLHLRRCTVRLNAPIPQFNTSLFSRLQEMLSLFYMELSEKRTVRQSWLREKSWENTSELGLKIEGICSIVKHRTRLSLLTLHADPHLLFAGKGRSNLQNLIMQMEAAQMWKSSWGWFGGMRRVAWVGRRASKQSFMSQVLTKKSIFSPLFSQKPTHV